VAWGQPNAGGGSGVKQTALVNVVSIVGITTVFAAKKRDGTSCMLGS